ncbi:class I SAM-dependent methyltransferase [bacterium]|nr:class I SAM-dependent methyltransferase [bacterium]
MNYIFRAKLKILLSLPKFFTYKSKHEKGFCSVCGKQSFFLADKDNLKESLNCFSCNAWLRLRFLAEKIVETFTKENSKSLAELVNEKHFSQLKIYELQSEGSLHNVLKKCKNYVCSEYFDEIPNGTFYKGVRCEDLQKLTFPNGEFDLVIHTSVLEHVRKPVLAFEELYRILKKGGFLIFEVPVTNLWEKEIRQKTIQRIDTKTEKDVFLLEAVFHGDPLRKKGALVYTDFGLDFVGKIENIGFQVTVKSKFIENSAMSYVVVFVCKK